MAVKIRLMRVGKKKQPTYRVVVADARSARDGRFIEIIGQYAPRQEPSRVEIDDDAALAWLRKGAQPTESVQKLLTATGVWAQFESERGGTVVTKLARRAYRAEPLTPKSGPKLSAKAQAKAAAAAEAAAAPPPDEPAMDPVEEPAAQEPAAEATDATDATDATATTEETE